MITSLHRYRWLLFELVLRDIVLRYRGSVLGFFWTFLNPLFSLAIYTLVFSVYLRVGIPHYAVFLLSGLLPWLWFSASIVAGATSIVDGRAYVVRSAFAPIVLVAVPILSNAVNYLLTLPLLVVIASLLGVPVGWQIVAVPLLLLLQGLLLFGIVLTLSTFNVFYRDLQQLALTILSFLFYLAPIIYPLESVPAPLRPYVFLNPMAVLVVAYQDVFYYRRLPQAGWLAYALLAASLLCAVGLRVFARHRDSFADYA